MCQDTFTRRCKQKKALRSSRIFNHNLVASPGDAGLYVKQLHSYQDGCTLFWSTVTGLYRGLAAVKCPSILPEVSVYYALQLN